MKFKIIAKYIYRLGIFLMIFPLIYFVFSFLPIEFISCTVSVYVQIAAWFSFPLGLLLTIFKLFSGEDNYMIYKVKVIVIKSLISFGLLYVMIFSSFAFIIFWSGCWTDYNILYIKKDNPNTKIIDQIFDEGAFGYGKHRIIKSVEFVPGLIYVSKIDTLMLHKEDWNFVNKAGQNIKFP